MANPALSLGWKVVGKGSAVLSGVLANKALGGVWQYVQGTEPPSNPEDPETTWAEALAWAIVSGAAIGVTRLVITRVVTKKWADVTGSLPPGVSRAA